MVKSLMLATTAAWIALAVLTPLGYWFISLFLLVGLLAAYSAMGTTRAGRFDARIFVVVVVPWALLWGLAFVLAESSAQSHLGVQPNFTIAGLHPSFAAMVAFYWVVSTVVVTWGYYALRDHWLSEERWEDFKKSIGEPGGEGP